MWRGNRVRCELQINRLCSFAVGVHLRFVVSLQFASGVGLQFVWRWFAVGRVGWFVVAALVCSLFGAGLRLVAWVGLSLVCVRLHFVRRWFAVGLRLVCAK